MFNLLFIQLQTWLTDEFDAFGNFCNYDDFGEF